MTTTDTKTAPVVSRSFSSTAELLAGIDAAKTLGLTDITVTTTTDRLDGVRSICYQLDAGVAHFPPSL